MCSQTDEGLRLGESPEEAAMSSTLASMSNSSHPGFPFGLPSINPMALAEYQHRLQLLYAQQAAALRMRLNHAAAMASSTPSTSSASSSPATPVFGLTPHPALEAASFPPLNPFARFDPRFRFMHEEPKPQHSYIGLIAMAILSTPDHKMVLSDIYQYILDNYPYFRNRGPGWRNSIRHNLSLNDCFVKAGRSANGKGHYWAIHPANIEDFTKGDFRRRKAQRKVRKHMGLSVPDDEDSNSPTPSPHDSSCDSRRLFDGHPTPSLQHVLPPSLQQHVLPPDLGQRQAFGQGLSLTDFPLSLINMSSMSRDFLETLSRTANSGNNRTVPRRMFDVESLLAPDCDSTVTDHHPHHHSHQQTSVNNRPRNGSTERPVSRHSTLDWERKCFPNCIRILYHMKVSHFSSLVCNLKPIE